MASTTEQLALLGTFLQPMSMDVEKCHVLSERFLKNFVRLSAESLDQFLPTPISESILRPVADYAHGRGGTNLRVGFVELLAGDSVAPPSNTSHGINGNRGNGANDSTTGQVIPTSPAGRVRRHLGKSWPISNHLKSDNGDSLFLWIGKCVAEVVEEGCRAFNLPISTPLPLGITFSFPAEQPSLEKAIISSMGKGFAIPPHVDLGIHLQAAYDKHRGDKLPPIYVAAIANDSVSTLISFIFNYDRPGHRRAAMGLILGTGSNATIPVKLRLLHPSKRPKNVNVLPGEKVEDVKIAVNTEWSINGTAPPMRELGLISAWDDELSAKNEKPGFQPLEYMTAGRYLGELGRIMFVDYMTSRLNVGRDLLPRKILEQDVLTTTFLSHFKPLQPTTLLATLRAEFPEPAGSEFVWTEHHAEALYRIAKAIEVRAAGIIAAAIIALLALGEEIPADGSPPPPTWETGELGVGYTGGCIVHFQDYLVDCQHFVDQLVKRRCGNDFPPRVAMSPCHDGGITGAGILVAAALSSQASQT
ncbi:hexokinase XprF [Metarhizium album ARSEF 1941]|uniref:Phosphotransferase n=1 Tax=Metarhizium album (strain ARSEF 1941) TaxID=1081103 RepID=A0A0B2WZA8_METAS|nr:hexokinase XprF [Metarhizium album ARSEF 1941]KHN98190.1 hexokinase XprF [Metarhizium album ARSEF 1941]